MVFFAFLPLFVVYGFCTITKTGRRPPFLPYGRRPKSVRPSVESLGRSKCSCGTCDNLSTCRIVVMEHRSPQYLQKHGYGTEMPSVPVSARARQYGTWNSPSTPSTCSMEHGSLQYAPKLQYGTWKSLSTLHVRPLRSVVGCSMCSYGTGLPLVRSRRARTHDLCLVCPISTLPIVSTSVVTSARKARSGFKCVGLCRPERDLGPQ